MAQITIATFNCENLFRRFKFSEKATQKEKDSATTNGFLLNSKSFERIFEEERKYTAQVIKETDADIIALQEVESMDTLKQFNSNYLSSEQYRYKMLVDANDPRLIDVGVLSRFPIESIKTHQFTRTANGKSYVFSRDCLEVNFIIDGAPLTLFVNHFKAMLGGREETADRRKAQSEAVAQIIMEKFGNDPGAHNWIVLGDLNDYPDYHGDKTTYPAGLSPLIDNPWIVDLVETRIPDPADRWTHWWDGAPRNEDPYRHLDYVLVSKSLADRNPGCVPNIVRSGIGAGAEKYTGTRLKGIGKSRPSASDHCPVAITINL